MGDSLIDLMWLVYFIDVVCSDVPAVVVPVLSVLFFILIGLVGLLLVDDVDDLSEKLKKYAKWHISITIILTLWFWLIPSKQTAWTMAGIYIAAQVADNPQVVDITSEGYQIIETKLKLYNQELQQQLEGE